MVGLRRQPSADRPQWGFTSSQGSNNSNTYKFSRPGCQPQSPLNTTSSGDSRLHGNFLRLATPYPPVTADMSLPWNAHRAPGQSLLGQTGRSPPRTTLLPAPGKPVGRTAGAMQPSERWSDCEATVRGSCCSGETCIEFPLLFKVLFRHYFTLLELVIASSTPHPGGLYLSPPN